MNKKFAIIGLLAVAFIAFFAFDLEQYLSIDFFQDKYRQNPLYSAAIYFAIYVAVTALNLPGAAIMTLIGGAIFGLWLGLLLVSFASSIGATLAFLISRTVLRDWVQKKFANQLKTINEGVEREGAFYLLTLRLIPAIPFFVINLAMGLTPMRTAQFYIVSQLGMLAGTAVYVNAGAELGNLEELSVQGIMTPGLLISFLLLACFPLIAKRAVEWYKTQRVLKAYDKPATFDHNLVVIGAGSGGLVAALIAAAVKAKVTLIERDKMGGDCLNTGCVPSKALLRSAKINHYLQRAHEFGLSNVHGEVDFAAVMERVQKVIKKIEPHDSVERFTGLGVECVGGTAKILSPYQVEVDGNIMTTRNIVIATGARPVVPPIPGLTEIPYLTSDTIWSLRDKPERMVVLGGGPIGCELAQAFQRLGVQVIQVEMFDRIMPREDPEVSELVQQRLRAEGIELLTSHKALRFESLETGYQLICEHQGDEIIIGFDQVLLALGRKANVENLGLEQLGIETSERGTLAVDEFLRTKIPNIYGCGDVVGPYQFTHMASHQAWYAAVNALFGSAKKFKVDYSVVPWATFTDPEVARVGLNETDARQQGIEYEVTRYDIDDLDRAIADEEDHGFIKVLTVPGKDKILGVTIVGYHAGELITEYILAMKHGLGLNKILGTTHIYPTLSETNKFVAGVWKKAHAPEKLLQWVEKFHRWQRS